MRVGFLGLGRMGAPMARNLAAAGYTVAGFDPAAACPAGVRPAATAAEAAAGAEAVVTMLPDGAALRAASAAVLPAMGPGTLFIDCSTVDVDSARAVAALAAARGIDALDAPVSGGTAGAEAASLTFMVGGDAGALDRARPLLAAMGRRTVACGGPGAGQAAKLCNNMILGVTMAATAEAFVLADALGLSRQALYDVVSTSSGQSWSMTAYCPAPGIGPESPADRGYAPGFAAELMLKDLALALGAAGGAGVTAPMGGAALELYRRFVAAGGGRGRDFSAVLPWLAAGCPGTAEGEGG